MMLYYLKIIVLFGIAVLLGQIIYITYNTSMYLNRGQVQLEVPQEIIKEVKEVEVEEEIIIKDWTDVPATL